MFDLSVLATYTLASFVIVIVPGVSVSLIIANSLRSGAAAGLANVAGTQLGLLTMIAVLAAGLDAVVALMGEAFFYLKLVGAAYLVYLGIRLLRGTGELPVGKGERRSLRGFVLQGFLVIWSNPKALLFFGAFIPQFVDPAYNAALQVAVLGGIFVVIATVCDSAYALAAGGAGGLLTRSRVKTVERIGGSVLVAGGIGLALTRR